MDNSFSFAEFLVKTGFNNVGVANPCPTKYLVLPIRSCTKNSVHSAECGKDRN